MRKLDDFRFPSSFIFMNNLSHLYRLKALGLFALLIILMSMYSLRAPAQAHDVSYTDLHLKAAYIVKMVNFISWPNSAQTNTLCIAGEDLIGISLAQLQTTSGALKNWNIVERSGSKNYKGCQILYIGKNVENIRKLLTALGTEHILTISDVDTFIDKGGMIGFISQDKKVRIEINNKIAQKNNISISSKLLEVAVRTIL